MSSSLLVRRRPGGRKNNQKNSTQLLASQLLAARYWLAATQLRSSQLRSDFASRPFAVCPRGFWSAAMLPVQEVKTKKRIVQFHPDPEEDAMRPILGRKTKRTSRPQHDPEHGETELDEGDPYPPIV